MDKDKNAELDIEWMQLIKEALEIGIEKEDIRRFLSKKNPQQLVLDK